jgi:hypothetical protein
MDNLSSVLNTLLMVGVVAALAPLIVALLPGPRAPQIVLLIIGGSDRAAGFRPVRSGGPEPDRQHRPRAGVPAGGLRA